MALSEQFLHASMPVNPQGDSIASSSTPLIIAGGGASTDISRLACCAVQVRTGHERTMAHRIQRVCGAEAVAEAFVVKRELPFRTGGSWEVRTDVLFPGYVLVSTPNPELLKTQLNVLTEFHHLVCMGDAPVTLTSEEYELLDTLGGARRMVTASVGEIVKGTLRVISGPLVSHEHLISKIDRHKRIAYLRPEAFTWVGTSGCSRMPKVGLEVTAKS